MAFGHSGLLFLGLSCLLYSSVLAAVWYSALLLLRYGQSVEYEVEEYVGEQQGNLKAGKHNLT